MSGKTRRPKLTQERWRSLITRVPPWRGKGNLILVPISYHKRGANDVLEAARAI